MPLNFDYGKVKTLPNGDDPQHAPLDDKRWHPVGDALVWYAMMAGYNAITEKNYEKVAHRIAILQALDGPMLAYSIDGKRVDVFITEDDVKAFIGLTTNASDETDAVFAKKLLRVKPARVRNESGKPAFELVREIAERHQKDEDEPELPAMSGTDLGELTSLANNGDEHALAKLTEELNR